jgi:hypothetical protein
MRNLLICFFLLFIISCTNKNEKGILVNKNPFTLSENEMQFIKSNYVDKVYINFFCIDKTDKNEITVKSKVIYSEKPTRQYRVVPVVEITEKSLLRASELEIEQISNTICNNLLSITTQNKLNEIIEIAVLYDFTDNIGNQKKFLSLISYLNKNDFFNDKIISLIVKISNLKLLDKSVIKAADHIIIDFGNTGNISDYNTINSLFDWNTVEPHISLVNKIDKPISAMLIVQPRVLVYRNNKFYCSIKNIYENSLSDKNTYERIQPAYYKVLIKTVLSGVKLEKNDILKTEKPDFDDYKKIAKQLNNKKADIIIYPINEDVIKTSEENDVEIGNIFDYFD